MSLISTLFPLWKLQRNTKKSQKSIKKIQERRFRNIISYAYSNSSFYKQYWESNGITKESLKNVDIKEIPKINKQMLIENFHDLNTINTTQEELSAFEESKNGSKYRGKYSVIHSSGSTGNPCYFVYDKKGWDFMIAGILRAALWDLSLKTIIGMVKKGSRILYVAASDGNYGGAMAAKDGISGMNSKEFCLDIKTPIEKWKDTIINANPTLIIGYPSAIKILCEVLMEEKINLSLDRLVTCGEPLSDGLKVHFEKVLKADVINIYGTSESVALGVGSSNTDGIILFDDMNIIEIESEKMYLTNSFNKAMPLIRYEISDILTEKFPSKDYPFSRIENIMGRNEDVMWFRNDDKNEFLHPLSIEGFCIPGLIDYQFIQKDEISLEIKIQIEKNCNIKVIANKLKEELNKIIKEKQLYFVNYEIRQVNEINPDPKTGKKKLVVI